MTTTRRQRVQIVNEDAKVTALELFFDLVFVYALTQVTQFMGNDLTGRGVVRGMVILTLFWWCWVGFSWLGNNIQADEGVTRSVFFAVMATMFVAALAVPESFNDRPGGLDGPLVLAVCYGIVRCIHLGLFALAARSGDDTALMRQLYRFGAVMTASIVLAIVGADLGHAWQLWFWLGAIVVDYAGTQAIGASGWRLRSAGHFAERHGLVIIIALGESIVSIGSGVSSSSAISWPIVIASVLGIALAGTMWWIYFDVTALAAERNLAKKSGDEQTAHARDVYSYLHLPMVAGIVLAALGVKKVLGYVSGTEGHHLGDAMHGVPPYALHVGTALMVGGLVALRIRAIGTVGRSRPAATALLLATIPIGVRVPALADLAIVAGVMLALIIWEATQYAETRHRVRHLDWAP